MTRSEAKEHLEYVSNNPMKLHSGIIFYYWKDFGTSERHIFANDINEIGLWISMMKTSYLSNDSVISFVIYLDGKVEYSYGNTTELFTES